MRTATTKLTCGSWSVWRGLALALGLLAACAQAPAQTVATIASNGPAANRINLVFLAEGYTSAQQGQFFADAGTALTNLLAAPPFNRYRQCFNAAGIFVASNQAGSSHPSQNVLRDTYFHSSFDSYGKQELVTIPPNDRDADPANGTNRVAALLQSTGLPHDLVILLVNDLAFGGADYPDSAFLIVSKCACISSPELIIHEVGHGLGGLADEYSGVSKQGTQLVERPNATQTTNRAQIKWTAWINASTPLPTASSYDYGNKVGLFLGANYTTNGWYRPKLDCMMNSLQVPFCEVCAEQLVKSIYAKVRPVDAASPASPVLVTSALPVAFNLTLAQAGQGALQIVWKLDGSTITGVTGTSFSLSTSALANGAHTVTAEVYDATTLVRNDPQNLLRQTNSWALTVNIAGH